MKNKQNWQQETLMVRSGLNRSINKETSEALYMTSGFVYDTAEEAAAAFAGEADNYVYSRYGNPTLTMLETRLAELEGADSCRACGTGMAAVFSSLACQLTQGDRVVASRALFGACHAILTNILPRWGIETILIDGRDITAWEEALSIPTNLVFLESPSNPLLELVDIAKVSKIAHKAGAKVIVDNVFATPIYQSPLELGADIVTYSTTKHMDGHGRLLGGAVLGSKAFIEDIFHPFYRQTGMAMSAFNAWTILKSLESLPLRVRAMSHSAGIIAERLADHPAITSILYPGLTSHPQHQLAKIQMKGFGSIISFEVRGGQQCAFQLLNQLKMIDISNNLGDAKTLACHPSSTTHSSLLAEEKQALSITEQHIRLSVGLEHVDDIWSDLLQALSAI